jgi:hypothetical protein
MEIYSIYDLMCKFRKALLFAVICLQVNVCLISAQERLLKSAHRAEYYLSGRGEVIIRFAKPVDVNLNKITTFLSIDNFSNDTVTAYANEDGLRQFLTMNLPFEVMQPPSLKTVLLSPSNKAINDWHNQYPSYTAYVGLMEGFAAGYPDLCSLTEFGTSPQGRKLFALKITDNPGIKEREPVVFYTSSMHGDETLGYVLMLRMIEYLLMNYDRNPQVKQLVDNVEIWINPLANPDGTYFLSDASVAGAARFNHNQVDLNRDFPALDDKYWEGRSRQPETKAMMSFMEGVQPVLAANFHGGAEVVNYPWDTWDRLHADDAWYRNISRTYADTAQYYGSPGYMTYLNNGITNGYAWYSVYGGRQDYDNFFLHGREVTIELSNNKMPAEASLNDYWNTNKQSLLQYIGQVLTGATGEVSDSLTSQPLKAKIKIENHDIDSSFVYSSATNGIFYRLTGEGNYIFLISSPGYRSKRLSVNVTEGALTQLDIRLTPLIASGLYPNPFSNLLYMYITEPGDDLVLEFIDMSGRKVKYIAQPILVAGNQVIQVNGLASGVYILNTFYRNQITWQVVIRKDY